MTGPGGEGGRLRSLAVLCGMVVGLLTGCSNNPYPEADSDRKVLYSAYQEPPKTLDPAVSYSTADHAITGKVYDTLLEYHYLDRPYRLIPGMAEAVPEGEELDDGKMRYVFRLRPDQRFADDPAFALSAEERGMEARSSRGRVVTAQDIVFQLQRLADPNVGSPVIEPFSNLVGFSEFRSRLAEKRKNDPAFEKLRIDRQYEALGGFAGARATAPDELTITLPRPYPQLLYWFAMNFTSPVPWEAVVYYDGEEGRPDFAEHPVGSGVFQVTEYEKRARMVLTRNPNWYGFAPSAEGAPAATFPEVDPQKYPELVDAAGKQLPFLERIEYRREDESIPAFSKFLQGYYDMAGIARESFDKVIHEGGLSPEMKERGMELTRSVVPGIYYIGFNMDDSVLGRAGGERARLLRQAMSLAVNVPEYLRLFLNGRGLPAESPIPPGIPGYDEGYDNPYRGYDLERARILLKQAGYPGGIDSQTGRPLSLTFDVPDPSPEGRLRYMFWVNQWRRLGLDVKLAATNYNKFQEKVRDGAYQIFQWGWIADYPDPENFLFLLTTPMARSESGGPNTANFKNERYDELFQMMKTRPSDERREQIIHQMLEILERERPWIELFHPEDYALVHGWLQNVRPAGLSIPTAKYYDLKPEVRSEKRAAWNRPILWPAFLLMAALLAVIAPGVWTFFRERQ